MDRKSKGQYLSFMGEEGIGGAVTERREFHWVNCMETSPWSENLRKIIHIPARNLNKFIFVYHLIKYLVWWYPVFWKKACGVLFCYFKVAVLSSFLSWKYTSKWTNAIGKMPSSLPPPHSTETSFLPPCCPSLP